MVTTISCYHLAQYKFITVLFSIFPMLKITSSYFLNWKFVPFNAFHLFHKLPLLPPCWSPPVCPLYLWVYFCFQFSSVQSLCRVRLLATPWIAARQASLSITNSWSSLRFMSIESVMPSSHLILCCPLLLLPPIPPASVFSNESTLCMRWPKYWSFSFSISPSSEHSGLISFSMDWLDLLAVQGTLKSLLQHHSSKASILWCSAFFIVQLLHPKQYTVYIIT